MVIAMPKAAPLAGSMESEPTNLPCFVNSAISLNNSGPAGVGGLTASPLAVRKISIRGEGEGERSVKMDRIARDEGSFYDRDVGCLGVRDLINRVIRRRGDVKRIFGLIVGEPGRAEDEGGHTRPGGITVRDFDCAIYAYRRPYGYPEPDDSAT